MQLQLGGHHFNQLIFLRNDSLSRSKVTVTRPLCSPPCWRIRRLQRRAWKHVGRGKLLLRCRLLGGGRRFGAHVEGRGGGVKAAVRKAAWWPWPFDLESNVWVTCDVGYLCSILVFPGLCSRVRPDVCDRQTSDTQKHRLMPPPIRGSGITRQHDKFRHMTSLMTFSDFLFGGKSHRFLHSWQTVIG